MFFPAYDFCIFVLHLIYNVSFPGLSNYWMVAVLKVEKRLLFQARVCFRAGLSFRWAWVIIYTVSACFEDILFWSASPPLNQGCFGICSVWKRRLLTNRCCFTVGVVFKKKSSNKKAFKGFLPFDQWLSFYIELPCKLVILEFKFWDKVLIFLSCDD